MLRILKQITLAEGQKREIPLPFSDPGGSNLTSVLCLTLTGLNHVGGCSEAMSGNSNEWMIDRQAANRMRVSHSRKSPRAWCVILFRKRDRLLRYQRDYVCVSSMWENMRLHHISQKCLKLFNIGLTSFVHQSINHNQSALEAIVLLWPTFNY